MRWIMINTAGMPSICVLNESAALKWRRYEIDRPNPQPGQYSIPRLWKRQKEKVLLVSGSINARNINAESQRTISSEYVMCDFMKDGVL